MKMLWRILLTLVGLAGLAGGMLAAVRGYVQWRYSPRIVQVNDAPPVNVAVVFGAGLRRDGTPQPVLYDRVATAVDLYQAGKVQHLLMSGDGRGPFYNEPEAMRQTAMQLGVPAEAIWLDEAGLDTFATCERALRLFGVQHAVLVTQAFHLPRALYLCESLGTPMLGVAADRRAYRQSSVFFWNLRETLATANAIYEVATGR